MKTRSRLTPSLMFVALFVGGLALVSTACSSGSKDASSDVSEGSILNATTTVTTSLDGGATDTTVAGDGSAATSTTEDPDATPVLDLSGNFCQRAAVLAPIITDPTDPQYGPYLQKMIEVAPGDVHDQLVLLYNLGQDVAKIQAGQSSDANGVAQRLMAEETAQAQQDIVDYAAKACGVAMLLGP